MSKRPVDDRGEVSAKELAEMGFCEKRMLLAQLYGDRASPAQRAAMLRGRVLHDQYYQEGLTSVADRRCFVATCLFGESAHETHALRRYRDVVLLRSGWGYCFVHCYYSIGPAACWILVRSALLRRLAHRVLAYLSQRCEQAVQRRRAE